MPSRRRSWRALAKRESEARGELEQLKSRLEVLETENDALQRIRQSQQIRLTELERSRKALEESLAKSELERQRLARLLSERDGEMARLQDRTAAVEAALRALEEGGDSALSERDRLLEALATATSERDRLLELTDSLAVERKALADQLAAAKRETEELLQRAAGGEEAQSASADRLTRLEAERAALESALVASEAERNRLEALLERVSQERDRLQLATLGQEDDKTDLVTRLAELEALAEQRQDLVSVITRAQGAREALAMLLVERQRDLRRMEAAQAALEVELAEAEEQLRGRDAALDNLTATMSELQGELATSRRNLTLADQRLKLAEEAAEEARAAREQAGAEGSDALVAEQALTEAANQKVQRLQNQIDALEQRLAQLTALLEASEALNEAQGVEIINLGKRLNEALATKVQELASYRSEFFGRLREVLGGRSDIQIVGDRFVLQSEVLFPSAQAALTEEGEEQLQELAESLKRIIPEIPPDIDWVLQVNGHTDRRRLVSGTFESNWELSAERALSVVRFLIDQGIPANRLAAAGFAEFQPIATGRTPEAYRLNRRIELKLTQR